MLRGAASGPSPRRALPCPIQTVINGNKSNFN
jgi:hypothetical protein